MTRLVAPADGLKEVDVSSGSRKYRYKTDRGGVYTVNSPNHIRQMKEQGFIEASLMGVTKAIGFNCKECGFGSFFKKCSRCGTVNQQEEESSDERD